MYDFVRYPFDFWSGIVNALKSYSPVMDNFFSIHFHFDAIHLKVNDVVDLHLDDLVIAIMTIITIGWIILITLRLWIGLYKIVRGVFNGR